MAEQEEEMTDAQYQRLIGIIFLVGSGCASRPGIAGLFFLIGVGLFILSYFTSRESDSESLPVDVDKGN